MQKQTKFVLKAERMKWIVPKEANEPTSTIQHNYLFEATYRILIKSSHEV